MQIQTWPQTGKMVWAENIRNVLVNHWKGLMNLGWLVGTAQQHRWPQKAFQFNWKLGCFTFLHDLGLTLLRGLFILEFIEFAHTFRASPQPWVGWDASQVCSLFQLCLDQMRLKSSLWQWERGETAGYQALAIKQPSPNASFPLLSKVIQSSCTTTPPFWFMEDKSSHCAGTVFFSKINSHNFLGKYPIFTYLGKLTLSKFRSLPLNVS